MPECETLTGVCPVHRAKIDKVRGAYTNLIMANYDHAWLNTMIVRTSKIMLDDDCPATKPSECMCKLLDDQPAEVLARAAVAGRLYEAKAAAWIAMVFEGTEIDGHTSVS